MSCFSHFGVFFLGGGGGGGGGGHGFLPIIVGYAMRGGQETKLQGKKSKIIIAPPLYINYEPTLTLFCLLLMC